ncbi:MAG: hypothetical protein JJ863_30385 [Deltaproteobacteria bacterium]|nr:hypothetical protein [Deltaproteobacteria bacterium]
MESLWHRHAGQWARGPGESPDRWALAVDGATALEHGFARGEDDPGDSWSEALATLRHAELPVTVVTRVTRSNQRSLEAIGASIRDADAWVLTFPEVSGPRADALGPRLAMALPWALRAATRWGERAFLHGAPLCLVGPHASQVLDEEGRSFAERCGPCAARAACPGVDVRYLERFAGDELRPRPPGAIGPRADPLLPAALRVL